MQRPISLLFLTGLGLLHAGPLSPKPLLQTQENFDLKRFMGKWYDIAKASTCPWMHRHKADAAIGSLELANSGSKDKLSMTRTVLRHGTCKQITGDYELTETPGRFYYHSAKWGADVDAYVVHTNYDEYALVVMLKQKGENKTTSVKLYGRKMELRPTLMDDFKTLVKEQGMSEDTIIIKKNKGECVPGEEVAPEPVVQRARRNVVVPPPEEGSGAPDDTLMFRGDESCQEEPDAGPCFGMQHRYHYNATLMACQIFAYGGCMGNQNNFISEKECLQTCRTEAACRLPMDSGPCHQSVDLWAFDSNIGKCVSFKYGGCKGNGNKFYSQKECEEYCGVVKDDEEFIKAN
ncbi:protein AMBP [Chanos chanos]|uniref:Protein AMBP n=1 Tax=Chanos chanos TaxID=29144 RepID=A0A6J2V210_CHACN|nr:protein AMBP [Chanos chanos]